MQFEYVIRVRFNEHVTKREARMFLICECWAQNYGATPNIDEQIVEMLCVAQYN